MRKNNFRESQARNNPLSRSNSLPGSFITVEDIKFDLPFEHSLFGNESERFVPED